MLLLGTSLIAFVQMLAMIIVYGYGISWGVTLGKSHYTMINKKWNSIRRHAKARAEAKKFMENDVVVITPEDNLNPNPAPA